MARPRSDIAPRLMVAARARMLQDGVDGASLRDIAREAGTSLGMIPYYFPSKDALFLAVVEEHYAGISRDITAIMGGEGTLEERVRTLFLRVAQASEAEIDTMRLVIREVLVSSERRRLIMERFLRGHVPAVFGALIGEKLAHPLGASGAALLALAVFPQVFRRIIGDAATPVPLPEPEKLAEALTDILFRGLRP